MSTPTKSFNPWPYSIIAFFVVAIIGAVAFIIFCNRHGTELVTVDYYEQELRHQQRMESVARTAQLQGTLSVTFDDAAKRVTVQLPKDHALLKPAGQIHFYRPSAAGLDRKFVLEVNARGEQSLDARELIAGLWRVRVTWTIGEAEFFADEPLVIGGKGA
jgi:hypothetical protein